MFTLGELNKLRDLLYVQYVDNKRVWSRSDQKIYLRVLEEIKAAQKLINKR